ncbi:hypothetical protein B9Z55_026982 [Caenorhabditis nigoni]|uniref:BTB domain-containing protein n=1 Tax=Caenorhabditis nigoni TaxID=1611254 RepID=A0A2G5SIC4_9PELO|nr:hypothetical protein B9Z55_026982 [Caenorhabditis nigoni]
MSETPALSIYESTFAKTDKTDAILVVDGKKLHVNKAILSYHSPNFKQLFDSNSTEKSMSEIEIKDVEFQNFAILLSQCQPNPISFTYVNAEKLLELADRFQFSVAKRPIELILIKSTVDKFEKIRIAEKYKLTELLDRSLMLFTQKKDFMRICGKMTKRPATDPIELAFAETDKTDAVLVVDEKKLHVNKSLLSYHSDYFNTLFNSDFKEKSMPEIEIKDVYFEDFTTLLSLIQDDPILPNDGNAERILELADRFLIPSAKRHVELFLLSSEIGKFDKIRIGEKYQLLELFKDGISMLDVFDYRYFTDSLDFSSDYKICEKFSDDTKIELFKNLLNLTEQALNKKR